MLKISRIVQHPKRRSIVCASIAIAAMFAPHAFSNSSEDCLGAWGYSDAKNTCEDESLSWFHTRQVCWVRANCLTFSNDEDESERNWNSIEVSFSEVYGLKNCSGKLKVSTC